jgi:hypothetical protein
LISYFIQKAALSLSSLAHLSKLSQFTHFAGAVVAGSSGGATAPETNPWSKIKLFYIKQLFSSSQTQISAPNFEILSQIV